MTKMFEDAGVFGKEFLDSGMKSFAAVSNTAQTIATEATDYSKKSYESGAAAMEKLFSASTLESAFEVQASYAKKAYEAFVAQSTKLGSLYADMAKEAYKPFESIAVQAK